MPFVRVWMRFVQVRMRFVQVRMPFVRVWMPFVQVRMRFVQVRMRFVQVRMRFVQVRMRFVQVWMRFVRVRMPRETHRMQFACGRMVQKRVASVVWPPVVLHCDYTLYTTRGRPNDVVGKASKCDRKSRSYGAKEGWVLRFGPDYQSLQAARK
jgi:hypothetical protein